MKWHKRLVLGAGIGLSMLSVATAAQAAEKQQVVVDLVNEPSTLDPQLQWNPDSYFVYRNIFDNLVTRDNAGKIVPQIATSWKNVSDTEIAFTLRDDVHFHDGSVLTAGDVAFSVNRIIDPKFASPQRAQFGKIVKAAVTGDHEVTLTLKTSSPALLAALTNLSIVPEHVVEKVGNAAFNLQPVGSGPYSFVKWDKGVSVTLARNDGYWGAKGPFATAVFRAVPDAPTRLADIQSGTVDLARALTSDQAAQLQTYSNAKALPVLTERLAYIRINPNKPPFDKLELRQALASAIDKEGITQGILGGLDKPLAEMVTPAHFGWSDAIKGLPFDPDKAKSLIAAAGRPAKFQLTIGAFFDQRVAQAIQQELQDVGFDVEIANVDTPTFLQLIQKGPADGPTLAISTSSCACQDADGALYSLFHSGSSWTIVAKPEIDALLDEAASSLDEKKRLADYEKVGGFIASEIPTVPLYQMVSIYGAAKNLDFQPTPNESFFLNRLRWQD
ncbi:ABC transporter substrate-binding protein [Rhizobium multihospitium]|uniref:Peptide/nickel transport system substrate-binding protein n=1 Tax=Rhizobium multihospitium TaxID=410764 RepID=A0A1C3UKD7_9HYPH|nr:ABC transporter substrate-binding protein [Rhizobium multihospitium]SCB15936.1 peptide/nickel transport system substrate-binding protein [Rhizobium multihospitium]